MTKENKNPNVPNLRFKYDSQWNSDILDDLCQFYKGTGLSKNDLSDDGAECILYGQLYTTYLNEVITTIISKTKIQLENPFYSKINDLIIPSSGEDPIDIAVARSVQVDNVLLGGDLNVLRPNNGIDSAFLSYQLNGKRKIDIAKISQGKSIVHLHNNDLKKIKIYYPNIEEQNKITSLLFKIDKRIDAQIKIIEDIKSLQMSIINRFILSRKANPNNDYYYVGLSNLLEENNEKKGKRDIEICSVSVSKGVINQLEYLGKSYASENTNNYNVVNPNDIIYTKSPTGEFPFGIVKQNKTEQIVAVSPLYGVYKPKSKEIGNLLHHYFMNKTNTKNYLCNLIQKGAKNTILISNQRFLENSIYIPSCKDIIMKISNSLDILDEKCKCEEKILKSLIDQKKYLLNNLFI